MLSNGSCEQAVRGFQSYMTSDAGHPSAQNRRYASVKEPPEEPLDATICMRTVSQLQVTVAVADVDWRWSLPVRIETQLTGPIHHSFRKRSRVVPMRAKGQHWYYTTCWLLCIPVPHDHQCATHAYTENATEASLQWHTRESDRVPHCKTRTKC